jgi:hypothetical protein
MIQRRKGQVIIPLLLARPGNTSRSPGGRTNFNAMSGSLAPPTKTFTPATVRVENLQQDFLGGAKGAVGKELANGRWVHLAIRSMVLEYLPTFTP